MNRLLLLRHAVTGHTGARLSGWLPGIQLSEQGLVQARALAERLAAVPIDAVYSSPLERCLETARVVAEPRGLKVTTVDDLGEVHYGDWTGKELKELAKLDLWRLVQRHPSGVRFPGGESLYELQARAVLAVEALRAEQDATAGADGKPRTVAVFSHADVIKALVAHYLGMHLDLYQRLAVSPASLTAVGFTPTPVLLRLNDTGDHSDLVAKDPKGQGDREDREGREGSGEPGRGAPEDREGMRAQP